MSIDTLKSSTLSHKRDVNAALSFLASRLFDAGEMHDNHKLATLPEFHKTFIDGFKDETWWNEHKKERHHLPDDMEDIDLIDILEHIADCTMAGMARSGHVYINEIPANKLRLAFQNTFKLLQKNTQVLK